MVTRAAGLSGPGGYYSPYDEPYMDLYNQVWGNLSLMDATACSISQSLYSGRYSDAERDRQRKELEGYETQLQTLKANLESLRLQSVPPALSTWQTKGDNLIRKCNSLIAMFERNAQDADYQSNHWHFRGALASLRSTKEELIACVKAFNLPSIAS